MPGLADVVRRHGPAYLERFGALILPSHVRAMHAIEDCRTAAMGGHLGRCAACGKEHLLYHSCRHRACPRCGADRTSVWLGRQRELLLPVTYFHVVFTVPTAIARMIRSHQKALLPSLFRAAFESLAAMCADPRYLGAARIGALAVLHTWTRTLEWHPHVHMLVPGGGIAPDGKTWLEPRRRRTHYLVPVEALGEVFRGRFLALARRALPHLLGRNLDTRKRWIVFAKPAVRAHHVLDYLGRYVHRTAMSDKGIVACDESHVTFAYRQSRDNQRKTMTLPPHEFLRRFLQHVPRKGFHRVRAFGLLHPEHRTTLRRLQLLLAPRVPHPTPPLPPTPRPRLRCSSCRIGIVEPLRHLSRDECAVHAARLDARVHAYVAARAPPPTIIPVLAS